jgi:dTDP-4-amino-4,6-dideoxygalactose transaminase
VSGIPLVDLKGQLRTIRGEINEAIARVLENTSFILGKEVAEFEEEFARHVETRHCVGVGSGTDALELILRASGVGPGAEVVLPANTFIATALAVVRAGARPVLVDCDPDYHLIDVKQVKARITSRTRALLPVHLFGQLAPMEELTEVARSANVVLLEDAAQAQGATWNGRHPAFWGAAAGTSFYPGKNLGALGDAGAVLTNSEEIAKKVRALRNYGSEVKYHHPELGFNSRLDSLQAVVLGVKLRHLASWNAQRREAASRYVRLLVGHPDIALPKTRPGNEHIWHIFAIRVPRRDHVLRALNAVGIGAGVHYPVPVHLQGAFSHLGHAKGDFPVAEQAASEMISLPLFPEITEEQQEQVVTYLVRALRDAA